MNIKYYVFTKCENCGKDVKITKYRFAERDHIYCRKCSINNTYKENPQKLIDANIKRKNTCIDKYNVDNVAKVSEHKEKWVKTKIGKTGYPGYFAEPGVSQKCEDLAHSEEANSKRINTYIQKTGYEHYMKSPELKQKYFENYKNKTGYYSYLHNPENISKTHKSKYFFNDIYFDSSWELSYYIWLCDNNIKFEYHPKICIEYIKNDKIHAYHPDFKVEDYLVEIKGDQFFNENNEPFDKYKNEYWTEKYECLLKNNVKILRYSDIKQYISYVNKKYGKNYIKSCKVKY